MSSGMSYKGQKMLSFGNVERHAYFDRNTEIVSWQTEAKHALDKCAQHFEVCKSLVSL